MANNYNSMLDAAFDIMSSKKRAIAFPKLWEEVQKVMNVSNDMVGNLYQDMSLDARFVRLEDNKWDLQSRRTFEEGHFDLSKLEMDEEEQVEEQEEIIEDEE